MTSRLPGQLVSPDDNGPSAGSDHLELQPEGVLRRSGFLTNHLADWMIEFDVVLSSLSAIDGTFGKAYKR